MVYPLQLQLTYVAEEMRNLSSMIVRAWDTRFEGDSSSTEAVDPTGLASESWSVIQRDSTTLQLVAREGTAMQHARVRIDLAAETSPVSDTKPLDMVFKADHYEVRIPTAESSHSTRIRNDLEIRSPYNAAELKKHASSTDSLVCASCSTPLLQLAAITRYNDLPSEHWAELLDAWMCHQDQTLSEELIAKGNNIWPKEHQALVSSTGVIVTACNAMECQISSEIEPTEGPDGRWHSVRCMSCRALVGRCSDGPVPLAQTGDAIKAYVRFSKIAIKPAPSSSMAAYSLAAHITAQLLETSLARAVYRFVVQDEEHGTTRMLLWLFNPYIRVLSNSPYFARSQPVAAVKILYIAGPELADPNTIDRLLGNTESDTVILPHALCLQLAKVLSDSSAIYPRSQRKLGQWNVGWLERAAG